MSVFRKDLFAGKHVFITGGSSGINLGIAHAFGEHGAKVSINGRNVEKLEGAVKELKDKGTQAAGFAADVRDYAALNGAIGKACETFGNLDVLVCGAAGNFPAPAAMMSSNGFKSVLEIDVLGTFNACRAAFERFNKPGASVLNISAPQAGIPYPMQAHVCAAKAGVDMISRTLAMEWGGLGIRVNSIWPGPIEETEGMQRLAPDAAAAERVKGFVPMQRFGKKSEVAQLALFLASEGASYCTGGVFAADGGMALAGGGLFNAMMG